MALTDIASLSSRSFGTPPWAGVAPVPQDPAYGVGGVPSGTPGIQMQRSGSYAAGGPPVQAVSSRSFGTPALSSTMGWNPRAWDGMAPQSQANAYGQGMPFWGGYGSSGWGGGLGGLSYGSSGGQPWPSTGLAARTSGNQGWPVQGGWGNQMSPQSLYSALLQLLLQRGGMGL